jgi:peptidase M50B-like protein
MLIASASMRMSPDISGAEMWATRLAASLDRIGQVQAHLSGALALVMALVGIGVAWVPGVWHMARPISAMAHEGAHATVGSAMGRKITRMEFKFNGDGETYHDAETSLVRLPITFSGYLGPSAFGIGGAELIKAGHIVAVLWIGLIGLVAILLLARRSLGAVMVLAALVALVLLLMAGTVTAQVVTTYVVTWFLLASGVRTVILHGKGAGDAGTLRELTGISRGFWPVLWMVGSVAAIIFGATLLF